jgi:hypothetical protein
VEPAAAALIGAGVGSAVAVGAQFLNHDLSVRRDRRNHKRDRLHSVVTEVALGLYKPSRDERLSMEDWLKQERHPGSFAALHPELARDTEPLGRAMDDGVTLLQVHFGPDHHLLDTYGETWVICMDAEQSWSVHTRKPEDERIAEIPTLGAKLRAAQVARGQWLDEARAEVERI